MDAIEALTTRRSCRSFKQEQIKNEELQMILACGLNAPSGKNKQSSKIVVVQNQEEIKELLEKMLILFMGHQQYVLSLSQKMQVMV